MNWSNSVVLLVIIIAIVSYVYSSVKLTQLSHRVRAAEEAACAKKGTLNCRLIATFHNEYFSLSYRTELKIRSIHVADNRACINNKISEH